MLEFNEATFKSTFYKIAEKECEGTDNYYKELQNLISDIQFFNLYLKREKKSTFDFQVCVHKNYGTSFNDLWKRWGKFSDDNDTIGTVFTEYCCLKKLIEYISNPEKNEEEMSEDEMLFILYYFEKYGDFSVSDYVGEFVGCSSMCEKTLDKLEKMREEIKDKYGNN